MPHFQVSDDRHFSDPRSGLQIWPATPQGLYIDPWGSGSQMEYLGGITGNKPSGKCQQLGMFELVKDNNRLVSSADAGRWNLIRTTLATEGTFNRGAGTYLEVVAGPWRF